MGDTYRLEYENATLDTLDEVIAFLEEKLELHDCPMKIGVQLCVAMEEMYVNIVHYAYAPETGKASVIMEMDNTGIKITLIDQGVPFDPLAKPDPDITLSAEERQIGGLGIYMVKKSMDEVSYKRDGDSNIFTMVKKWG
ncbi:MAG: ATP-binding protein [Lachnospiraceae bacterium]|nr:ATP-binding protein [Lachnospiraceae bacterium]